MHFICGVVPIHDGLHYAVSVLLPGVGTRRNIMSSSRCFTVMNCPLCRHRAKGDGHCHVWSLLTPSLRCLAGDAIQIVRVGRRSELQTRLIGFPAQLRQRRLWTNKTQPNTVLGPSLSSSSSCF